MGQHLFAKMPGRWQGRTVASRRRILALNAQQKCDCLLAIDDADIDSAAMQFVPGTHRRGALEHEQLDLDGTQVLGRQVARAEEFTDRFLNVLKAGQVSLHSDLLLHGSDANDSNRRRAGLTLRYTAQEAVIEGYEYWRKNAVHCLNGDPSGYWFNRQRPEGEHPEKMSDVYGEFDGQPLDAG